jgi:hypothetical protein
MIMVAGRGLIWQERQPPARTTAARRGDQRKIFAASFLLRGAGRWRIAVLISELEQA